MTEIIVVGVPGYITSLAVMFVPWNIFFWILPYELLDVYTTKTNQKKKSDFDVGYDSNTIMIQETAILGSSTGCPTMMKYASLFGTTNQWGDGKMEFNLETNFSLRACFLQR